MILFGAFKTESIGHCFHNGFKIAVIMALWGVVISAVYMLRAYRAVFMGDIEKRWSGLQDMAPRLRWAVILLLATLTIAGFFPQLFLNFITPGVQAFLALR